MSEMEAFREAFEKWWTERYSAHRLNQTQSMGGDLTGVYVDPRAERSWQAWQAAQAQAVNQQLPENYVPVPIEPTEAMIDAGVAVAFAASVHGKGGWNNYMKSLYRAFIKAAQEVGNE